jgi:hypothetical protein
MNIRQPAPEEPGAIDTSPVQIDFANEGGDVPEVDQDGNVISIEHDDGSITISLDGNPLEEAEGGADSEWFGNLVDEIDEGELNRISGDLFRGIDDDLMSRKDWIETRAQGVKLLGLKIEIPALTGATDGAPVEGMSRVRHPLLLEAVLRFQANSRSELLPTDGPVKIRNDNNNATLQEDQMANALERDLNHYLTSTATEYYPDTDRMLLMLGFGGTAFKKIYYCPLRNRPVSETVDADDLIVSNDATDLSNARRVTHRITMRPSIVKRMQILGVYRDVDLGTPGMRRLDPLQREERDQQGISAESTNPLDRDREIYECYCELDIKGFEHKHKGKVSGLEIPYRVTVDVSSKEILSIVRNYNEDTEDLPVAKRNFVKYTFVPGLGFYDIGLLHILGNTTNAITAAWRELLDAGMYSNFPGFLMADTGARQNTNIFRVPPGGGALIKTGGMPISQAVMPLPYQPPSQALMQLVSDMAQTGARIGGTSEMQVGEGRADAPVGTTIAMIEQATKVMNAVHKRLHAAQAEEFRLLCDCFRENPESFWQRNSKPTMQWDQQMFLKALDDYDLTPQADPNTASHGQRIMKITALKQLQQANPSMYDPIAIDVAALQAIGWSNPSQFMAPPNAQASPPPELLQAQAKMKNDEMTAQARMMEAQARAAEIQAKIQSGALAPKQENPEMGQAALNAAQADLINAETKRSEIGVRHQERMVEDQNRDLDRQSRERVAMLQLARDLVMHPEQAKAVEPLSKPSERKFSEGEKE